MTPDLSFAEQQLWLADRGDPQTPPFFDCAASLSFVLRLEGALHRQALEASLNDIVCRHDVLRSRFAASDGHPVRHCAPDAPVALTAIDLRGAVPANHADPTDHADHADHADRPSPAHAVNPANRAQHTDCLDVVRERVAAAVAQPFDLAAGPLLRASVSPLGRDDQVLAITAHHIVFDRWSRRVLAAELKQLYEAHAAGQSVSLPPLEAGYSGYVAWQREMVDGPIGRELTDFWTERLRALPDARLPGDAARDQAIGTRAGSCWFTIPADETTRLTVLSRRARVTLATTMLAIFKLWLYRSSGVDDLAVGVPLSDRRQPEFESLIGLFMNTIVARTALTGSLTFLDLVARVQRVLVDACRFQDLPYGYLLHVLQPRRPLYRVVFNFMPGIAASKMELAGLRVTPIPIAVERQSFADLSLHVRNVGGALVCRLLYKADLFSPALAQQFARQIQQLTSGVLDAPQKTVAAHGTAA